MALAVLSVDLVAKLASLEAGFDKSYRLAEKNARAIEARYQRMGAAFSAIGSTVAGAFAGVSLARVFAGVVDGIDDLNDFAEVIGTTVENASALEGAMRRTGGSLADVQGIVLKLSKTLDDLKPASAEASVLQQLGLDVEKLRKLDPAEALRQVAVAVQQLDDASKAQAFRILFDKTVREAAPFLNDLAREGQLVATVTKQQAEEAEKFNKQLYALQANAVDFARAVSGPMISSLNEMIDKFKDGAKEGKSFYRVIYEEQLRLLGLGGSDASGRRASGVVAPDPRDALRAMEGGVTRSLTLGGGPAPRRGGTGGGGRSVRDAGLTPQQIAQQNIEAEEYWADAAREISELTNAKALKDYEERVAGQKTMMQQYLEWYDQQAEEADEAARVAAGIGKDVKDVSAAANDLGLTFSSAFEDAIVGGRKLSDVLKGLEQDILRIVTRQLVTKPLGDAVTGAVSGAMSGGGVGSFFSSLFSGFFAAGGFIPPGHWGIAGERGPEPVYGGRTGATVRPAGGRSVVVNQTINVSGPVDKRTSTQIAAEARRALLSAERNL
jgi:hypothetical protein